MMAVVADVIIPVLMIERRRDLAITTNTITASGTGAVIIISSRAFRAVGNIEAGLVFK